MPREPKVLWDRGTLPPRYASDRLGISRWELREALHRIKRYARLRGDDLTTIYDNGDVRDAAGNLIGNILDERH